MFASYSTTYAIEDTRYAPLTCDFKIIKKNNPTEQSLVELKSSGHCELKPISGTDQFIIRHRQYHPLNYAGRTQSIFSVDSGRWTWLMTVPGKWKTDRHELPRNFLFIHRTALPPHWDGSADEWVEWPSPMSKEQLQARFLVDIDRARPQAMVAKVESWLNSYKSSPPSSANELLVANQSPASTTTDDEIESIAGKTTVIDDIELPSTTVADDNDGAVAESSSDPEGQHLYQHQEDQSMDFFLQCRRR